MPLSPELAAIRFGYGLPVAEGSPQTAAAMITFLAGPDEMATAWPIAGMEVLGPLLRDNAEARRIAGKDPSQRHLYEVIEAKLAAIAEAGARATLARALDARDALRERLVTFWADHFTVVAPAPRDAARPAAMIEDAIRPNLTGPFAEMLIAVSLHPAMLIYLDQAQSIGPNSPQGQRQGRGLNENFAREVMELHTLGAGAPYSQDDVRQLAEALTGLTYDPKRGVKYDTRRAEPGAETVLGTTYEGESPETVRRVLSDLAARPETAAHLARKLAVHFVSDSPEPALVSALETAWLQGKGALLPVYEVLLTHPAATGRALAKARQPWDYLVAALRALGVRGADVMVWPEKKLREVVWTPMRSMGQFWRRPRGPDGWREEAAAWITPQALAARIDWAMNQPQRLARPLPDPAELARSALGDLVPEVVIWAATRAEKRSDGVGIVFASAEFNRR